MTSFTFLKVSSHFCVEMPKNSLFTPLTSVSAENHSWVPRQKLLEPVPSGVQRGPSALCRPVLGLWLPLVSGPGDFKPPQLCFDLCSCSFHSPLSTRPPKLLSTSPAGFFKNRSCFLRRRFSFPCVCGIKAVCGAQGLSPFSLWNLLDLWQAGSQ